MTKKLSTKETFQQANSLYHQISNASQDEFYSICEKFNTLIEEYDFNNELFTGNNGLEGLKLCYGEVVISPKYDKIHFFRKFGIPEDEIYAIAIRGGKHYLVDHNGNEVLVADEIYPVNGMVLIPVAFKKDGKWGIAYNADRIIVEARYDKITCGSNGFYFLSLDGKEGFITPWNDVINPKFDSIEIDADERFVVTLNGETGYVDENGEFTADIAETYYGYNTGL